MSDGRERGTIVSWSAAGTGRVRADNGDLLTLLYSVVLSGFHQLGPGQRVEFSRAPFGSHRTAATLVVAITESDD